MPAQQQSRRYVAVAVHGIVGWHVTDSVNAAFLGMRPVRWVELSDGPHWMSFSKMSHVLVVSRNILVEYYVNYYYYTKYYYYEFREICRKRKTFIPLTRTHTQ